MDDNYQLQQKRTNMIVLGTRSERKKYLENLGYTLSQVTEMLDFEAQCVGHAPSPKIVTNEKIKKTVNQKKQETLHKRK